MSGRTTPRARAADAADAPASAEQELRLKTREARELRRHLQDLADGVLLYLDGLDTVMKLPDSPERGRRIAALANALDMANDKARYGALGVDYRRDDKGAATKKLRARAKPPGTSSK